ncbi:conjugal transfer protein TraN [Morganella morganii]
MNNRKKIMISAFILSAFLSASVSADKMRDSSKEGHDLGKSSLNQAKSSISDFKPAEEFENFNGNPDETRYQNNDAGLSNAGNKELSESELGKTARESFINNPKDKISWDSDILVNALDIKNKADVIAGGSSEECVKQTQNETYFTNHICEKEENINTTCTKKAVVNFKEKVIVTKETKTWAFGDGGRNPDHYSRSGDNFTYVFPHEGKITKATYSSKSTWGRGATVTSNILGTSITYNTKNATSGQFWPNKVNFKKGEHFVVTHPGSYGSVQSITSYPLRITLTIEVEKKEIIHEPYIVWVENCPIDKGEAVKIKEWCSQKGETRKFVKDGRQYEVYSDCWEYSEEWVINDADDNTCKKYEDDPNCTPGERKCLLKVGNSCIRHEIKYQCQHTTRTEGYVCGGKFYCDDGSCVDTIGSENNGFADAVSQLAALAQAGKEMAGLDEQNMRAFTGKAMHCRKAAAGFSNCCKSSGWGNDIGLASCNSEEKAIGKAKEKDIVISVGTYCSNKVLGVCLQKKSSYCVFDNKLARIVQSEGRLKQLGIGFGSAKSPDCRGISIYELQNLRFDNMDFSDFFDELNRNVSLPDQDKLLNEINQRVQDKFEEGMKP